MSQVSGTFDTYDATTLKESLDPVIWDLFPMDTFALSNFDKVSVGQTLHEWVFDKLASAAANKQLEGDDVTYSTVAAATRVSNYTQISRKTILLTDTYEASDKVGQASALARETMKAMKELKRDMEYTILGKQGSSAGATATARACGGLEAWIWGQAAAIPGNRVTPTTAGTNGATTATTPSYATGVVTGVTDGTTGSVTLSEVELKTALGLAWEDGGEVDVILTSQSQKLAIDAMTGVATRFVDVAKGASASIVGSASMYVSSYGTHKVVLSRYLHRGTVLCLDTKQWAVGQLRAPKIVDMAKTGDATKKLLVSEYTLVARNPNSSAAISACLPL